MERDIVTLDTRIVYANKWMRVREDRIRRKDGSDGLYGVVEKEDFAVVVPIVGDRMVLVEQYRYPVEGRYWEFPQGSREGDSLSPIELARAELREETGFVAGKIEFVGSLFTAYGYSNQAYSVFLATELVKGPVDLDPEELDLISREFQITEVERMILSGEIRDATAVAAFGLAKMKGLVG
jgi:ADP-ribose pyrophosphatase